MQDNKIDYIKTDLRKEIDALRKQVNELSELAQELKSKGEVKARKLSKKLGSELEHYQEKAGERLHDAYEAGDASLNELNDYVHKNPISSLMIAGSVGYAIFKILGKVK